MTNESLTDKDFLSPDYRAVLRLLPKDEKRRLITLTNYHGVIWLSAHLTLIAGMAWLNLAFSGPIGWLAIVGQGIGLCFLFCAMHEAGHGTAFHSKTLNTLVTSSAGLLLFLGPLWFQSFHAAHHRHTNDPALDPELAILKPQTWGQYLFHLSGIMVWISSLKVLFRNAVDAQVDSFIASSSRSRIKTEARLMLLIYTIILSGGILFAPQAIIQFWLLPLLLGQPFLRLFLMAEHAGCPHDSDMLKNSRTTHTNPLVLFLSWNMPYHTAHHSFPAVPFHKLPAFHHHIAQYTAVTADGYSSFHQTYARHL